jgi:hypothetical protein
MPPLKVALKKTLLPWLLSIVLLEVSFWFGLANVEYVAGSGTMPLHTAGWFVIGQASILVISTIAMAAIAPVCLFWSPRVAWALVLVGGGAFLLTSVWQALPRQQLARVVGREAARSCKIERLSARDSFNDGRTLWGTLETPPQFLSKLNETRSLKEVRRADSGFRQLLQKLDPSAPQDGILYEDDYGMFCFSPDMRTCCFYHRTRLSPARDAIELQPNGLSDELSTQ